MKKGIFVFLFIMPVFLAAQQDTTKIELWTNYEGYIINNQNDTVFGYIRLNNLVDNQEKALFFENENDSKPKNKFKPKDLIAYRVGPRYYESFKFKPTGEANRKHFFLKIISGPIDVYEWYYEPKSRNDERVQIDEENILDSKIDLSFDEADLASISIAVKQNEEPEKLTSAKYLINFKKHMSRLVDDYEGLANKIKDKEEGYRLENQLDIIREYNQWHKKLNEE